MEIFEFLLLLLAAAVMLSALARRIGAPYPALLALGGAAIALTPFNAPLDLDPALVLALFLAPVLLDAAFDAPLRDLKTNWIPLAGLVFVAVGLTTAAVAMVARFLVPDLPVAAAIALGAIVAPPDAAAASVVLRTVRPPHRLLVILEGESLLNDASALLVYRMAVSAAMVTQHANALRQVPALALSVLGSFVMGFILARIVERLMSRVSHVSSSIVLQFVSTWGVWILAERLSLSPVLTIVVYGMTLGQFAPAHNPAAIRIPSYAVWDTAVMVLNAVAFVLIGLQLRPILAQAPAGGVMTYTLFGAAVLATCILVRLAWVLAYTGSMRLISRHSGAAIRPGNRPTWTNAIVASWCGMRGIVTLVTALALPATFPHRDLILYAAFAVTFGTLTIQGLTLRPLMLRLKLAPDNLVEREVQHARIELADVAHQALKAHSGPEADLLRSQLQAQRAAAAGAADREDAGALRIQALRRLTLDERRGRLLELRRTGVIGDDAFHRLEEELDLADLNRSG
jgi:monovalent cation/hydrogen antiporter